MSPRVTFAVVRLWLGLVPIRRERVPLIDGMVEYLPVAWWYSLKYLGHTLSVEPELWSLTDAHGESRNGETS